MTLRDRTILLTVAGSRAHGTAAASADVDVRGVALPTRAQVLGLYERFEQADGADQLEVFLADLQTDERSEASTSKLEGTVYELRKFLRLAAEANPNILEVLFSRDAELRRLNPLGARLRAHRQLFLSAHCRKTYGRYAAHQLGRIRLHHRWHRDGLGEGASAKERSHHAQWLQRRNPQRAAREARFGYDTKHGAHLVRLLRMGLEIVTTGQVRVWRGGIDADELRAIRDGAWSIGELAEWADGASAELESATACVPEQVDRDAIDALCIGLVEDGLR